NDWRLGSHVVDELVVLPYPQHAGDRPLADPNSEGAIDVLGLDLRRALAAAALLDPAFHELAARDHVAGHGRRAVDDRARRALGACLRAGLADARPANLHRIDDAADDAADRESDARAHRAADHSAEDTADDWEKRACHQIGLRNTARI